MAGIFRSADGRDPGRHVGRLADEGDHVVPVRAQHADEMTPEETRGSGDEIAAHDAFVAAALALAKRYGLACTVGP